MRARVRRFWRILAAACLSAAVSAAEVKPFKKTLPDGDRMSTDKNRPEEKEAVRTTIVGGRPPGSGRGVGSILRASIRRLWPLSHIQHRYMHRLAVSLPA